MIPEIFEVSDTSDHHRSQAPYDYVVAMQPELAAELGLADRLVVSRRVVDGDNPPGKRKRPLRAFAVVVRDPELERHQLRIDQTLRNALGIPFMTTAHERDDLELTPLRRRWRQELHRWLIAKLGRRYVFLRVAKPHPPDIEKGICRVSRDTLTLLGTEVGNRIALASPVREDDGEYRIGVLSLKAFDLERGLSRERDSQEVGSWAARYVAAGELLGVEPDIGRVFLDLHAREALDLEPGDPVKVRRDFPDLFKQRLLEVGVLLAISIIALTGLVPESLREAHYGWFLGSAIVLSAVITCAVIVLRLRARVR